MADLTDWGGWGPEVRDDPFGDFAQRARARARSSRCGWPTATTPGSSSATTRPARR